MSREHRALWDSGQAVELTSETKALIQVEPATHRSRANKNLNLAWVDYIGIAIYFEILALKDSLRLVVPALMGLLDEEDPRLRIDVAGMLRELGPAAREALPRLCKLLKAPDGTRRGEIANAIAILESSR